MHISKAPKCRIPIDLTASNDLTRVRSLRELQWLSPERLAKLVASLRTFDVKRGDVIFDEHQAAKYVYLLLSGTASITCLDTRQKRLLLALAPIGVIPKLPLLPGGIGTGVRCEAFSNCRVGRIDLDQFVEITMNTKLEPFLAIFEALQGRWASLFSQRSEFLGFDVRQRLASTLLDVASEFGIQNARGRLIRIVLTHKNLADLVGASRQTVTECLLAFAQEGIITRSGHQFVVHPERVRELIRPVNVGNRQAHARSGVR